jgi:hypothetical protein
MAAACSGENDLNKSPHAPQTVLLYSQSFLCTLERKHLTYSTSNRGAARTRALAYPSRKCGLFVDFIHREMKRPSYRKYLQNHFVMLHYRNSTAGTVLVANAG